MISICIPIFNFDVRSLVLDLCKQIQLVSEHSIDIILIDDASEEKFRSLNNIKHETIQYIQLEQNIGRSKIRNLFLTYTSKKYLLFLDCDSSVTENLQFVQNYLNAIKEHLPMVVCGGRIYPNKCPSNAQSLSWSYGVNIESRSLFQGQNKANSAFQSSNFLIQRLVFQKFPFEVSLNQYGHEDTLFGIALFNHNIAVLHIDNPILNIDIADNDNFILNNALAAQNLAFLVHSAIIERKDFKHVRLLVFYRKLESVGLEFLFAKFFTFFEPYILNNLKSSKPNLKLFNLYKLFLFIKEKRELEEVGEASIIS